MPSRNKYPPVDLEQFVAAVELRIGCIPILRKLGFNLGFAGFKELKPFSWEEKGSRFYEIIIRNKNRIIQFDLFPKSGGYYVIYIKNTGYESGDDIVLSRYFDLYDKDSPDRKCIELRNFTGSLDEKVEQSLNCINRILEERFEGVLKGEEWIDVPSSFYDYK